MTDEKDKLGAIKVEMGDGNSVGHIGHKITYQAPPKLTFSDALGAELLAKIPNDKRISVRTVGSGSDQAVGTQVVAFLLANGYEVNHHSIGMLVPPPDKPLSWDPEGLTLTVAPSAR